MRNTVLGFALGTALLSGGVSAAMPDWSKVPGKEIIVFYPGVTPMEWILKHGGVKGMRKGDSCLECHEEELDEVGNKIAAGKRYEPKPLPDKAGNIPVTVQVARDETNLYLRFQWKQPPRGGGPKMDKDNSVKLAFMLEDNKVEWARIGGCWATCHIDARTMPEAASDKKTKYVVGGSLENGVFYDLMQFRSGNVDKGAAKNAGKGAGKSGSSFFDGYVADKRVMEGGQGLLAADGQLNGDMWTVTFTRKLAADGVGDIVLVPGKTYNFGFAIHDDHAIGRYHHVSMGYTLGIDAKADLTATAY